MRHVHTHRHKRTHTHVVYAIRCGTNDVNTMWTQSPDWDCRAARWSVNCCVWLSSAHPGAIPRSVCPPFSSVRSNSMTVSRRKKKSHHRSNCTFYYFFFHYNSHRISAVYFWDLTISSGLKDFLSCQARKECLTRVLKSVKACDLSRSSCRNLWITVYL